MFKYYTGIAIMCSIFAILAVFFSANPVVLTTIFLSMAGAFLAIAFVTSGSDHRW